MSSASDKVSGSIDLSRLALPFEESDVEWRVSRAWLKNSKIYCTCLAYCTARAIQKRLDEVCGPENWRNEAMHVHELRGPIAIEVGISIRINGEWVTKYDVSDPTHIEPVKGGFSGAMKRAGAQWGIGRYLYQLDESFAETSEDGSGKGWTYGTLPDKQGGGAFYWKAPRLPGWALPKEPEYEVKASELKALKDLWRKVKAPDCKNPSELREGFRRFVEPLCGDLPFPVDDNTCWVKASYEKCMEVLKATTDPQGVSADVRFN